MTNALDTVNGGADDNSAQANHLVTARTLTSSNQRIDGETETFVPVGIAQNQRGALVETDYSHQLTSGGGKPGQGYPAAHTAQGVRRLTPLEAERLQGFPDGWTAMGADSRRYAALGNAVTVNVARWIGERLQVPPVGVVGVQASTGSDTETP